MASQGKKGGGGSWAQRAGGGVWGTNVGGCLEGYLAHEKTVYAYGTPLS